MEVRVFLLEILFLQVRDQSVVNTVCLHHILCLRYVVFYLIIFFLFMYLFFLFFSFIFLKINVLKFIIK